MPKITLVLFDFLLCTSRFPLFPPHATFSESYRSPYGEPHHYCGPRNLLDPNMAYCKQRCLLLNDTIYTRFSINIILLFIYFHFTVQMVTCLFLGVAFLFLTGTYHQGELFLASLVPTALRASTVEVFSLIIQYSKYLLFTFTYFGFESRIGKLLGANIKVSVNLSS